VGNVTSVGFDADGKWLYTGGEDGTVRVWDPRASTSACQRIFDGNKKPSGEESKEAPLTWNEQRKSAVNSVVLHPNQGELVAGDQGGRVRIYDLGGAGGGAASTVVSPEPEIAVRSVAVASDGTRVFFATDSGNIHQWQPASSESLLGTAPPLRPATKAHDAYILKIIVSPDCKLVATASADHTAKIFRASDMSRLKTLAKHQRWVWDLQFSADSSYLVTASSDTSCRLWDVSTGETVRNFLGHHKAIVAVCLNDASIPKT
jgi:G protein beta subunit-like protein